MMKKFAIVVAIGSAAGNAGRRPGHRRRLDRPEHAFGTTVSNADKGISFKAPDAKAGQEMADVLNKVDKRDDKKNKDA